MEYSFCYLLKYNYVGYNSNAFNIYTSVTDSTANVDSYAQHNMKSVVQAESDARSMLSSTVARADSNSGVTVMITSSESN